MKFTAVAEPTRRAALLALAERVEQASGADASLDSRIQRCIGASLFKPYTRSLDAALTLVPEGWWLTLDRYIISDDPKPNTRTWRIWLKRMVGDIEGDGPVGSQKLFATGATPALALTAAALRARAAMEEGGA